MKSPLVLRAAALFAAFSLLNVVACHNRANNDVSKKPATKTQEQVNADQMLLNSVFKPKFPQYEAANVSLADSILALDLDQAGVELTDERVGPQSTTVMRADLVIATGEPLLLQKGEAIDSETTLQSAALGKNDLIQGVNLSPIKLAPGVSKHIVKAFTWCLQPDCARVALMVSTQVRPDAAPQLAGYIMNKSEGDKLVIATEASARRTLSTADFKGSLGDSPSEKNARANQERRLNDAVSKTQKEGFSL